MKNFILLIIAFTCAHAYAQEETRNFCDGTSSESYFPLNIDKKELYWDGTYYKETNIGDTLFNEKSYVALLQTWENGSKDTIFFREDGAVTYQYNPITQIEVVRYNNSFKKGHSWKADSEQRIYTLTSKKAKLKTPYCTYSNLLEANAVYGSTTFTFYFQKGYGFVGAKRGKELISYVVPFMD